MIEIVPACYEHVEQLCESLRVADLNELEASGALAHTGSPRVLLELAVALSVEAWAGVADGETFALCGVAPHPDKPGVGTPWMLGSPQLARHGKAVLKTCVPFIHRWLERFPLLTNHVDARNRLSIRWLRWCGFSFDRPAPTGVNGELFITFYMERPDV